MTIRERTSDPWYDMHAPMSDKLLDVVAAPGNPEEALAAAEEQAGISAYERGRGVRRLAAVRESRCAHPERRVLKRLSTKDREVLLLSTERSAPAIAAIHGVSKQAIHKRQKSAQKRLDWYAGPGRLFNGQDIHNDFAWRIADDDRKMLKLLWHLRSFPEVARQMKRGHAWVRVRFLALLKVIMPKMAEEEPERFAKYVEGFRALRLLMMRNPVLPTLLGSEGEK